MKNVCSCSSVGRLCAVQGYGEPQGGHPKLAEINAKLRERVAEQEAHERKTKTELVQKATSYLEDFYKVFCQYCPQTSSLA